MKIVINRCYGGFGLSDAVYAKLIEWGIPAKAYIEQKRGPDGRYLPEPRNDGEVIFDTTLYKSESWVPIKQRYWDDWTDEKRTHPLLVRAVEDLGSKAASGDHAKLEVIEIPDGVEWEIDEYDGIETVHEKHRSWP